MKKINEKNISWIPASHENPEKPGVWKKVLICNQDLDPKSKLMSVLLAKMPVRKTNAAHIHKTMEEIFYFTEGKGEIRIDGEIAKVKPGDRIIISAGKLHQIRNTGETELKFIGIGIDLD